HYTQPQLEGLHFAVPGMPPLRENQDVDAGIGKSSHVSKGAAESLCLGQRKEVEQHGAVLVAQAPQDSIDPMVLSEEELFPGGGGGSATGLRWQCKHD